MRPDWCPFAATASELQAAFARSPIVCAGPFTPEGKLTAPDFPGWQHAADFVLVEADGSKRLPAKAHASWEPVLPPQRKRTVCAFGASALGQSIQTAAHRPALHSYHLRMRHPLTGALIDVTAPLPEDMQALLR